MIFQRSCFQFLGIPPKGERWSLFAYADLDAIEFPISRDPPEGGTMKRRWILTPDETLFPISRDPPEGGTN